jgi:hypothetical protein
MENFEYNAPSAYELWEAHRASHEDIENQTLESYRASCAAADAWWAEYTRGG